MHLEPVPDSQPIRFVVGGTVRKPPDLLRAHLASLDSQILPPRVELTPVFVDDNVVPDSTEILKAYCETHHGVYLDARAPETPLFADNHPVTHQWSGAAMQRVGNLKNQIFQETLSGGFDGVWLVDADLICSPRTLWSLYFADAPIACAVFWTRWQDTPECPALPQVWLRHPYQLDGRGMQAPDFLRLLIERQRVQVWGQGACTLYRSEVLRKGLSFDFLPDLPTEGMWQGEDRHLCTRAERLHIPMMADAWADIRHCYHPAEQTEGETWLGQLNHERPGSPVVGDLVSLQIQPLEPVQTAPQQWQQLGKTHSRGQLGKLPLVREIETALGTMER